MTSKLNGWQRIGAVLTAMWIAYVIAIASVQFNNFPDGSAYVRVVPGKIKIVKGKKEYCTKPLPPPPSSAKSWTTDQFFGCDQANLVAGTPDRVLHLTPDRYHFMFGKLAAIAIFPVLIAWCAVYLLIFIARWILAGFRNRKM